MNIVELGKIETGSNIDRNHLQASRKSYMSVIIYTQFTDKFTKSEIAAI